MLRHAERLLNRVALGLGLGAGMVLLLVAMLGVSDAVLRYGFTQPIFGALEASQMLLALLIFAALPNATAKDRHVAITSLVERLPSAAGRCLLSLGQFALALFLGLVAWQMVLLSIEVLSDRRTTLSARIPLFPFVMAGAASVAAATLVAVVRGLMLLGHDPSAAAVDGELSS